MILLIINININYNLINIIGFNIYVQFLIKLHDFSKKEVIIKNNIVIGNKNSRKKND